MPNVDPSVSIICAAYNRADVLRFAIESVLAQDFQDWELIVIGDACTDHTEATVLGFRDPRISFENMPRNSGGQAAPNNRGLEKARGRYIFFLNQDDMYLPHHVGAAVRFLDSTGADIAWNPIVLLLQSHAESGPPDPVRDELTLDGAVGASGYDPRGFYIASSWAMRREACDRVGPWRAETETRVSPSQDWLFRAWKGRAALHYRPDASVFCIHAGRERLSYRNAPVAHRRAWSWISDAETRALMFACVAVNQSKILYDQSERLRGQIDHALAEIASTYGVHATELERFLDGQAPGDWIRGVRRHAAEAETLAPGVVIAAGSAGANAFFARGWHTPEGSHRWSAARIAEIAFDAPPPEQPLGLRLKLMPVVADAPVAYKINGVEAAPTVSAGNDPLLLLPGPGPTVIEIGVTSCFSARQLGSGDDQRPLGVALFEFELVTL